MRGSRSNSSQAAAVSRALAAGGRRPIPSGAGYRRVGLHVRRSSAPDVSAWVTADLDTERQERQALADATAILVAAGYVVSQGRTTPSVLCIRRTPATHEILDTDVSV